MARAGDGAAGRAGAGGGKRGRDDLPTADAGGACCRPYRQRADHRPRAFRPNGWISPAARTAHPLSSIRITNNTGASLPAGVLTLYDASGAATFAGDARLGGLPAGENRLLSFAQDLRTTVERNSTEQTTLASLTAAQGVLHITTRQREVLRVTLTAPATEARRVLVEIPQRRRPDADAGRRRSAGHRGDRDRVARSRFAEAGRGAQAHRLHRPARARDTRTAGQRCRGGGARC